jgi:uridine kinase
MGSACAVPFDVDGLGAYAAPSPGSILDARRSPSSPPAMCYGSTAMGSLIVGIAGGTGSGKTTVAKSIAAALPVSGVSMIEYDAYYRDRPDLSAEARALVNYDHPDSLESDLLVEHLDALRAGHAIDAPIYDFKTHRRRADSRRIAPAPVIVVEGILVFVDPRMRERLDMKIFVDTDPDIRVFRRIRRDMEQRGRSFESIREQYYKTVRPMHLQFVEPSKRWADLIIPEGGNNRVALDLIVAKLHTVLADARTTVTPDPQPPEA